MKVTYNLFTFNPAKVQQGVLCVMVSKNYSESTIVNTSESFGGAGICKYKDSDRYLLTVDSVLYQFNGKGEGVNAVSNNYKLLLGGIQQELVGAGGAVESSMRTVVTRSADGTYSSSTVEEDNTVLIDSLNARDNFALNALRALIQKTDRDPASFGDNEMAFYCDVAYKWAANMMAAAAKVRATLDDESGPSVDEGSLSSNTEKLLYDMSDALIDTKGILEDLTQAVQDLDAHICDKLQALVEK